MTSTTRRFPVFVLALAGLALLALSATPTQAQTELMVWRIKFTCGFAAGNIPDSGSNANVLPVPYREVQPGNYSTAINILNHRFLRQRDALVGNMQVFTQGRAAASIPSFTLAQFSTARLDCNDITTALATVGFQADGRFVEGFIVITARDQAAFPGDHSQPSELEVSVVYSYGSRRSDNGGTGLGSSMTVENIAGKLDTIPE